MNNNYQVWIRARDPVTLAVVGSLMVFEHADRLTAEAKIEGAMNEWWHGVQALRNALRAPIISAEMEMPAAPVMGAGAIPSFFVQAACDGIWAGMTALRAFDPSKNGGVA